MLEIIALNFNEFLNIFSVFYHDIVEVSLWVDGILLEEITLWNQLANFVNEATTELDDLHPIVVVGTIFNV
jgi:hypothetical protein